MNDTQGSTGHPALTDGQTGLPNRLHFETVFEVIFASGARGVPITVLLMEIDGFYDWVGQTDRREVDRILGVFGSTLRPVVRKSDLLARVEEARLAICLLDCNVAGAVLVADRVDGLLDTIRGATGLAFSMGGASFSVDMTRPEDLLGAAESALRSAQAKGPNQMEFHR